MPTCINCGKAIKKGFTRCYDCEMKHREIVEYHRYLEKTPQEREDDLELYYSHECYMCGKEGADWHEPDGYYCGSCWTIWKS